MGAFSLIVVINLLNRLIMIRRTLAESKFFNPQSNEYELFPGTSAAASVDLSVVVPSYNEEERLPVMMDEALEYLEGRKEQFPDFNYEIIVVDDGSRDQTSTVALRYAKEHTTDRVRVLTLEQNRGKGGAVRMGVLSSRGRKVLMADADGATKFSDLARLEEKLKSLPEQSGIAVGSRAHLEKEAMAKRNFLRNFISKVFQLLVWMLCVRTIRDTQCGFKLFSRSCAITLFSTLHVERWAFDVELLYLAEQFKVQMVEVAVNWTEIDGSKLIPVFSWIQMGKDILLIRIRYMLGIWRIEDVKKMQ